MTEDRWSDVTRSLSQIQSFPRASHPLGLAPERLIGCSSAAFHSTFGYYSQGEPTLTSPDARRVFDGVYPSDGLFQLR
jgi:hypothetical protein